MIVRAASSFDEKLRPAALARYPTLGDAPTVVYVAPGSGAAAAGIQRNDVVTAVNGEPIPPGGKPLDVYARFVRGGDSEPLVFSVQRAGEARDVTVAPQRVCSYPVASSTSRRSTPLPTARASMSIAA